MEMNNSKLMTVFTDTFFHTSKHLTSLLQRVPTKYHLSFEQYQILRDIANDRGDTLTDIVHNHGVTKPAIARHLRTLRERGLLIHRPATEDHRRRILTLTKAGSDLEELISRDLTKMFGTMIEKMGSEPIVNLIRAMEVVNSVSADV